MVYSFGGNSGPCCLDKWQYCKLGQSSESSNPATKNTPNPVIAYSTKNDNPTMDDNQTVVEEQTSGAHHNQLTFPNEAINNLKIIISNIIKHYMSLI